MADKSVYSFGKKDTCLKTGQTTVYTTNDDGTYQAGNPSSPRFVDNGDGTITDMATGLMWVKDPSAVSGINSTYDFSGCITAAEGLTYAGNSDWRLPNINELASIVNYGANSPAKYSAFESLSNWYQSSTTKNSDSANAWRVNMADGTINPDFAKVNFAAIRPVRGGI
jgi:hypothetical protein